MIELTAIDTTEGFVVEGILGNNEFSISLENGRVRVYSEEGLTVEQSESLRNIFDALYRSVL